MEEFAPLSEKTGLSAGTVPAEASAESPSGSSAGPLEASHSEPAFGAVEERPPLHIGDRPAAISPRSAADAGIVYVKPAVHPLDRRDEEATAASETIRIRLAWAKLCWLLAFLAVLLAISYLVPFIAENTQYAITRGRQRAEHDFALTHISDSPLRQMSRAYQMVSQAVGPCVVHINTRGTESGMFAFPMGGARTRIPTEGQGSGFLVDSQGHILTNYHVIRDASDIQVALSDGRRVKGQIVGIDAETDLALLKISADKLTPARWGNSDDMQAGALVWAVGSPFGLERSITSGILSAKNRAGLYGTAYQDFLQTDAAVNPGNSGGPLVNASGEVIGINTAIVGDAYQGISFAVPSNVARDVCERLKAEGQVLRGWLGVQLEAMTEQLAKDMGLEPGRGAYIAAVVSEQHGSSPAARAGILPGDVVLSWNGDAISGPAALSTLVAKTEIGSAATIVVLRDGERISLEVTVGQRPVMP